LDIDNLVAFILLSISPLILAELHFLNVFVPSEIILVLVASTILAASVSHTFLSFIPAAFIGARKAAPHFIYCQRIACF
jgi:TctA family transporter